MRVAVFFVICLTLHNIVGQTDDTKPEPDCEDLTARIQAVKKSTKNRKEKFSCFLSLLKNSLADELEKFIDPNNKNDDVSDKTNVTSTHIKENEEIEDNENNEGLEKDLEKQNRELQTEQKECENDTKWDIPTMIPIFKPVINDKNPLENSQMIPKQEATQANQSPLPKYPAFTIPCQRAADILDMSFIPREINNAPMRHINLQDKEIINDVPVPQEIICDERREANVQRDINIQPKDKDIVNNIQTREINIQPRDLHTQPRDVAKTMINEVKPQSNLNFCAKKLTAELETPKTLAVHCKDVDESVAVLFKPKAITLEQLYGNLLKKLTITVLVPYHMAQLGKKCGV